jgi:hypothetical protein
MAERHVSTERQMLYYAGMFLSVVGALVFFSMFVTAVMGFGDFTGFGDRGRSFGLRAVVGMGMMIVGRMLMNVGKVGLAGSGVLLDPQRARRDVEPWSRMTGGAIGDALDEAGVELGGSTKSDELPFDEKLRRLYKLQEEGILTDEEYQREKQDILREK